MAKDPVRDLFGTFSLIALLKRAAAETVGIWAVLCLGWFASAENVA